MFFKKKDWENSLNTFKSVCCPAAKSKNMFSEVGRVDMVKEMVEPHSSIQEYHLKGQVLQMSSVGLWVLFTKLYQKLTLWQGQKVYFILLGTLYIM